MQFEYDPNKSAKNKEKHGIDFEEGQAIWDDPKAVKATLNYTDEERYFVTGKMNEKIWTAICTDRGDNVRIISIRRSHKSEENYYENGQC